MPDELEVSAPYRLIDLMWTNASRASRNRFNGVLGEALRGAIIHGFRFAPTDLESISRDFGGGRWMADPERLYRLAIEHKNTSACVAVEHWLDRKPVYYGGKRVHVGAEIVLDGKPLRVTSFAQGVSRGGGREWTGIVACAYDDGEPSIDLTVTAAEAVGTGIFVPTGIDGQRGQYAEIVEFTGERIVARVGAKRPYPNRPIARTRRPGRRAPRREQPMGRDELLEVTMTARALGCAGVEIERAMERAARAHRDGRFAALLDARRRELDRLVHGDDAPGSVLVAALTGSAIIYRRAKRAGLSEFDDLDELLQVLPRVEVVRELLGPEDHIEALGPHPTEVS